MALGKTLLIIRWLLLGMTPSAKEESTQWNSRQTLSTLESRALQTIKMGALSQSSSGLNIHISVCGTIPSNQQRSWLMVLSGRSRTPGEKAGAIRASPTSQSREEEVAHAT